MKPGGWPAGMVVGCYTLDLYCVRFRGCPHQARYHEGADGQYSAESEAACRRNARRDGWRLLKDDTDQHIAICATCWQTRRRSKKGKT